MNSKIFEPILVIGMVVLAIVTAWAVLTPNHLGIG